MASDRDTLTAVIVQSGLALDRGPYVETWPEDEREHHRRSDWPSFHHRAVAMQEYRREKLADAVIALGWRPPAQVITDPAKLADLPIGSAVLDAEAILWQLDTVEHHGHYRQPWWLETGSTHAQSTSAITMPVTVLYFPAEEAESRG